MSAPADDQSRGDPLSLTEAQRRAIGVRLDSMRRLIGQLRAAGVHNPELDELRGVMCEIESATGAVGPAPPPNSVRAMLAQLWVTAMELRARGLRAYGGLDDRGERYLDASAERLASLVSALLDEHERDARQTASPQRLDFPSQGG